MTLAGTKTDDGIVPISIDEDAEPSLVLVHHPDLAVTEGRLRLPANTRRVVGRGTEHLGLDRDDRASREHAALIYDGHAIRIEDLGSRNGTFVDGQRLDGSCELVMGSVVGIGHVLAVVAPMSPFPVGRDDTPMRGISAALGRVMHRVSVASPRPVTVLIAGETGVGKELVARALHDKSGREGPFLSVNCSAISDGVLHSELFGHARGAFSGAGSERPGLVRSAAGGTLFLDEIGDASPALQASLLRLLEQGEYRPVGSDRNDKSDVRVVAATHVDLSEAVERGDFRRDLHARLRRWVIDVPPLRQRREDVLAIARHFVRQVAGERIALSRRFMQALLLHDWPDNVRELHAVIEESVLMRGDREELEPGDSFTATLRPLEPSLPTPRSPPVRRPSPKKLEERYLALGCRANALADELGIGRTTLYRWCRELGVDLTAIRARWERGDA